MVDLNAIEVSQLDHEIVSNGLSLMKSITEKYGPDTGLKLWDTIAEALGPKLKGDIFFALMLGTHQTQITIRNSPGSSRVAVIKIIRTYTGLGLKEAKDLFDPLMQGHSVTFKIKHGPSKIACVNELVAAGCVI